MAIRQKKARRSRSDDGETFLHVEEVNHVFPDGVHALADISLSIPAGSFTVLVGPSGVGKSTLLRILGGLLQPTAGRVRLKGYSPHKAREPIGIVFQQENLMPWRTAYENVRLPLEITGKKAPDRVTDLLQLVGLQGFEQSYPAQLSGGMAQRVALARALVHEPDLLLMDEPFGALDALTRERMGQELLRIWRAMPVTVFMVTHSISEAVLLADDVLVMTDHPGRITGRVTVDLPRPRELSMQSTAAFHECAGAVRAAIENGNASVAQRDGNAGVADANAKGGSARAAIGNGGSPS
ncbi:MAG: ABC transporter ATP-binding protein [Candidatus Promineifilaceae bacterium]|nr:ABC transporter ATP-binding protein [Candidatus Promineifilaceae bacterium]